ncbi:hypothetical protein CANCADRAFT_18585, partial [Tortispora caseinolytica NRRL Y-17796]
PTSGLTLYSNKSAPNAFKAEIVLCELEFPHRTVFIDFGKNEQKSPEYLTINPNARVPTLVDHDADDFAVWESGSIVQYLCEKKGMPCSLWSSDPKEKAQIVSWLYFEATAQANMFGQALHFLHFHETRIPSAVKRYLSELRRMYGVVEMVLAERREQLLLECESIGDESEVLKCRSAVEQSPVWLVGDRTTVADLSFVPWNEVSSKVGINLAEEFPEVALWHQTMLKRPMVQKALTGK